MPLTNLHVIDVCKPSGGNKRCKYLAEDEFKTNVYHCLKKTSRKDLIDAMVSKKLSSTSIIPEDYSLGDNCKGYPFLRHVPLGYDKDS